MEQVKLIKANRESMIICGQKKFVKRFFFSAIIDILKVSFFFACLTGIDHCELIIDHSLSVKLFNLHLKSKEAKHTN